MRSIGHVFDAALAAVLYAAAKTFLPDDTVRYGSFLVLVPWSPFHKIGVACLAETVTDFVAGNFKLADDQNDAGGKAVSATAGGVK